MTSKDDIQSKELMFFLNSAGIDQDKPLLYRWVIFKPGQERNFVYVGKAKGGARRPLLHYRRNVAKLLAGRDYSKRAPDGFREVHRELAEAVLNGYRVELTLLRNVDPSENIFKAEQDAQREHGCNGFRK